MNDKKYNFKKAKENDLQYLIDIAKEIIKYNYSTFLEKDIIQSYLEKGLCEKDIFENINDCIIMELNDKYIGFSIILGNNLHLIMIDKKYQNEKHGKYFLKYLEDKLFKKYNTIELQSFAENKIANNFYINNGWKCNGKITMENIEMYKYKKDK